MRLRNALGISAGLVILTVAAAVVLASQPGLANDVPLEHRVLTLSEMAERIGGVQYMADSLIQGNDLSHGISSSACDVSTKEQCTASGYLQYVWWSCAVCTSGNKIATRYYTHHRVNQWCQWINGSCQYQSSYAQYRDDCSYVYIYTCS